MPIHELHEYVVFCGGCKAHGGHWRDRSGPDECVPPGWTFIEAKSHLDRDWIGDWYDVFCPECAPGMLKRLERFEQ